MAPAGCLLVLLAGPLQVRAQDPGGPLARGLVRSVEIASEPGTRVQHFRMDRDGARADELPLALLRYVAGPGQDADVRVELELRYLAEDLRLHHTEQASTTRRRLIFRELRERAGRTLFLEGGPTEGFAGYELGGTEALRRTTPRGGELPLLLIESARAGLDLPPEAAVLEPLAGGLERLGLVQRVEDGARVFEARRADGSLRWRVTARGEELVEWRFHERGPSARAVSRTEFERVLEQHESAAKAAREAAARAARPRGVTRP